MDEVKMAEQESMPNADKNGGASQHHQNQRQQQQQLINKAINEAHLAKPIFHDFFGGNPNHPNPNQNDSSAVVLGPNSPSSASASDLASGQSLSLERRAGSHLEGVPFYGHRSDISGTEMSNKMTGSKRSNSDGVPQIGSESLEGSHLIKLLRSGSGGERLRRSNDDEVTFGSHQQTRPTSASLIFQPPSGGIKMDRAVPMNAGPQYPPRGGGHYVPFMPHVLPNRFREANAGPSNISHSAADEGSRTGKKGPGILSSLSPAGGASERNPSASLQPRQKGATVNAEPESSAPLGSQQGFTGSRQMTIFYGGQAHVFDDVHPNKADVIMALAGSNGGSWSTTFSPKSTAKSAGESQFPGGESEPGPIRDHRGRPCIPAASSQGLGFNGRMSIQAGGLPVGNAAKDTRNSAQMAEPNPKEINEQ